MWILVLYFLSGPPTSIKWFPTEFSCEDTSVDVMSNGIYGHADKPIDHKCKEIKDWRRFH